MLGWFLNMCMLGDLRGAIKNAPGSPLSAEVQGSGPKILTFQSQMPPLPCRERMCGTPQLFSPPSFSLSGISPDGNAPAEHLSRACGNTHWTNICNFPDSHRLLTHNNHTGNQWVQWVQPMSPMTGDWTKKLWFKYSMDDFQLFSNKKSQFYWHHGWNLLKGCCM